MSTSGAAAVCDEPHVLLQITVRYMPGSLSARLRRHLVHPVLCPHKQPRTGPWRREVALVMPAAGNLWFEEVLDVVSKNVILKVLFYLL